MEVLGIIENLNKQEKGKVIDHYQLLLTEENLYLINTSQDYSKLVKYIFSGVSEIVGLVGGATGIFGGLLTQLTGDKLGKFLKELSNNQSDKRAQKIIENLEQNAGQGKGIEKIASQELQAIMVKKGYWVNGRSWIELIAGDKTSRFFVEDRQEIDNLLGVAKQYYKQTRVVRKLV